jgi:hypothetical protein
MCPRQVEALAMASNIIINPLPPDIDALDLAIATLRNDRWCQLAARRRAARAPA